MDGSSQHLLSRAALATQQYGRIGSCDTLTELHQFAHAARLAHDETMTRVDFVAQDRNVAAQAPRIEGFGNDVLQVCSIERLLQEVVCTSLHGAHGSFDAPMRGNDDEQWRAWLFRQLVEHREAVMLRHLQVE